MHAAFTLRIFKIPFCFGAPERLRTLRCSIFTKEVVTTIETQKARCRAEFLAAGSIDNWETLIRLRC